MQFDLVKISKRGLLNILYPGPIDALDKKTSISERECSKKSVQQGRSHFDPRSVPST